MTEVQRQLRKIKKDCHVTIKFTTRVVFAYLQRKMLFRHTHYRHEQLLGHKLASHDQCFFKYFVFVFHHYYTVDFYMENSIELKVR